MKESLKSLTVKEKLRLICGKDAWHTCDLDGKIPSVKVTDASMGIHMPTEEGYKPSVSYPSLQMLCNTWSPDTVRRYAECVADDCLDYGADVLLGPGVNIKRSPTCGRNFEYFSEDPYLAGVMAREYVSALQGEGAGACLKHFCTNNLEYNRFQQSSDVDERTLREIYYKPFELAMEAKPLCVMCSYNRINGVYGSEYKKGYDTLRKEYGFDGLIMSDWGAVRDRTAAAKAGCDLEMPFSQTNYGRLVADFEAGKISEEEIDVCAERVLTLIERCEQLQRGKKRKYTQEERLAFAQEAEEEGIVLLKNDGVLPLKKGLRIAACGLYARPFLDGRKFPDLVTGGGSGNVVWLTQSFDVIEKLERATGGKIAYDAAFYCGEDIDNSFMFPDRAVDLAAESDACLVFAGTGARIECEGGDRRTMRLPLSQERAILGCASVNPNTVVVLFAGAPIDMSPWLGEVAAVVYAGFCGERGDTAIANVLTGKVNPSGKLTETFPLSYEDTPAAQGYIDNKVTRYEEGLNVGYRYYDTYGVDVLFPFGFGLSYSKFVYQNLTVEKTGDGYEVRFELTNASERDGKEVSQVYVRAMNSYVYRPYKELKGFQKTFVKAGKTSAVHIKLDRRAFEYWSTAKDCWDVEDGVYEIIVASSADTEELSAKIKVETK